MIDNDERVRRLVAKMKELDVKGTDITSNTKIHQSNLSKILNGKHNLSDLGTISELARYLHVSMGYFLDEHIKEPNLESPSIPAYASNDWTLGDADIVDHIDTSRTLWLGDTPAINCAWVNVYGDQLAPKIRDDAQILIARDVEITDRDLVIMHSAGQANLYRVSRQDSRIKLIAESAAQEPIVELTSDEIQARQPYKVLWIGNRVRPKS